MAAAVERIVNELKIGCSICSYSSLNVELPLGKMQNPKIHILPIKS